MFLHLITCGLFGMRNDTLKPQEWQMWTDTCLPFIEFLHCKKTCVTSHYWFGPSVFQYGMQVICLASFNHLKALQSLNNLGLITMFKSLKLYWRLNDGELSDTGNSKKMWSSTTTNLMHTSSVGWTQEPDFSAQYNNSAWVVDSAGTICLEWHFCNIRI